MDEGEGVDLICLIDPDSSVRVRILGRNRPGDTPYNDYLDAELVITSAFVSGRLGLCLSPEVMDDWSTALNELSERQGICWTAMNDAEIRIEIDRQFSVPRPIVTVDDSGESGVSVRIVLDPGDGWVDELREHLGRVRQTWPNEVVTTPRSRNYWQ
ncbi:DUF5959 family protein [Streptomyces sp. G3]|uniref:DUF5959 family protein n=1 Tax=unclassified Streptomyces TaxID=2593676 RepID=UPI0011AF15BD|nr:MULTISPECIES: DUF5959 family protein [unclassified Streptomyces]MCM1940340.1 DUF5959 family protein [Streptomyces sp. G3]NDZ75075.1 hypothetical protein [Streptomyces sp. SID10362]WKX17203.1 DUF5959 family protein [Streptomyces sp. HUAS CX7]